MQKMARRQNKEGGGGGGGGNHLEQESNRQKTMEDIDGGLHPAVDGQSLSEGEGEDEDTDTDGAEWIQTPHSTSSLVLLWVLCQKKDE